MKWISVLLYYVWLLLFVEATLNNYTFTYNMALSCKEHICQHGYTYETFYKVETISKQPKDPEILFEMHIAILASSNGHILLSSVPKVGANDPVYEIVIGGGVNKFTELRRNARKNARASAITHGILSPIEFRAFYIKINEDGVIQFGREGDLLPIINYMDHNPISINYFSFAAWNGVEAKFLYDCPKPGENETGDVSTEEPDSEAVERNVPNYESLMRALLWYRDPRIAPASEVKVNVGVQVTSVSYDELQYILNVGVSILLKWTDNSLAWNPNKFNGTTYLSLRQGQIWSPVLYAFDDIGGLSPIISEPVTIVHSGEATLHMQLSIKTWCSNEKSSVTKWPQDEYSCAVVLEPWEVHDKILITLMDNDSKDMKPFSEIQNVVVNAWNVSVNPLVVDVESWNTVFPIQEHFTTGQSDRIVIDLTLMRRSAVYNIVFYTPLIVLVAFLLMSFWTEPLQMERVRLYICCVIIICMGLCYIDYLVPCYTISSIVILYLTVLGGVILALLIQVAMMTSLAETVCKTSLIQDILVLRFLRNVFCLKELKVRPIYAGINESYSAEDSDDFNDIVPKNGEVEEMQTDTKDNAEKMEVAEVLDKLLFAVYTITFAVMLALH